MAEVQNLKVELDRFKKTHNEFAIRTAKEIDELFAKIKVADPTLREEGLHSEGGFPPIVRLGGKNYPSRRKQPSSLPMRIKSDHEA